MKIKEIRGLDDVMLSEKLSELRKELIKINAQIAIGTAQKNTGQVKKIKKTIARIMGIKKGTPNDNDHKKSEAARPLEVKKKHE
ncbi:50S ribosomal protein L29 [Candidatus Woesearchaeota archaeon]|nr:50S ribosomal protein L29 [Candidatus Woesearchaeota archaeon]